MKSTNWRKKEPGKVNLMLIELGSASFMNREVCVKDKAVLESQSTYSKDNTSAFYST